jgi:Cu(I)/Ag(I) efflux system membrane fusion protein
MTRNDMATSSSRTGASRAALVGLLLFVLIAGVAGGVLWSARIRAVFGLKAGEQVASAESAAPADQAQLWTCGMHPQVIQDRPGTCPICGMALTPLAGAGSAELGKSGERKIKYWSDPMMNPPYISDRPGKSPMGMDLIPVYEDEVSAGPTVTIDPSIVQNMGVRLGEVEETRLTRHIRAVGTLEEAEPNRFDVNLRIDGWIDALHADFEGKHVEKGEPLFDLYSPALQVAVEELIAARKMRDGSPARDEQLRTTADSLYETGTRKLQLYGVADEEIERLATLDHAPRAVTFRAPATGHVLEKMVYAGAAVKAGDLALRIVDHTLLWLDVRVFAKDSVNVRAGQEVTAMIEGRPNETFEGEVIFIHPHVDPTTRTTMVRLTIANPDLSLRPGMYATASLEVEIAPRALVVPREAVIDTGRSQVAFVALDQGHFEPRKVAMGPEGDDGRVQVLSGLVLGEKVVVSGQFLLDAESRMREAIQKFLEQKAAAASVTPEMPAKGALAAVSEKWQGAADEAIGSYLHLSALLGAPQKSDNPLDSNELIRAARTLRDVAGDQAQSALSGELLAAAESLRDRTLDAQREMFKKLSESVLELAERSPRAGRIAPTLYLAHCPMVDASWLQEGQEIANPYYATTMKSCGEVVRQVPIPRLQDEPKDHERTKGKR